MSFLCEVCMHLDVYNILLSYLRIGDSNGSLNEAIVCVVNADSGHDKLSILHHSTGSGRPVLGTHLHPSLLTPTQHHHHTTFPLIQHLHKVLHCSCHWTLSNDESFPLLIALYKNFQLQAHIVNFIVVMLYYCYKFTPRYVHSLV